MASAKDFIKKAVGWDQIMAADKAQRQRSAEQVKASYPKSQSPPAGKNPDNPANPSPSDYYKAKRQWYRR